MDKGNKLTASATKTRAVFYAVEKIRELLTAGDIDGAELEWCELVGDLAALANDPEVTAEAYAEAGRAADEVRKEMDR